MVRAAPITPEPIAGSSTLHEGGPLHDPDPAVRHKAAKDWCDWEDSHVAVRSDHQPDPRYADEAFRMRFARLPWSPTTGGTPPGSKAGFCCGRRRSWPDASAPAAAAPSVRTVVGWITRHPDTLTEDDIAQFKAVRAACPELEKAHQLVRDFGQMLTLRTGAVLPERINDARTAQLPGITGFARGLTCDVEAVAAGLTLPWNSGGTEGAVNRVKKIKRQLYGRAGFELLRKMILLQ